ncbi:hypothetical protein, partial [Halomonas marinisediminis]|uniref:hypothetical protein n=1 Tax=Halomonas marinisediminis TaxID=2546095 RepID=UPI00197AA9F1
RLDTDLDVVVDDAFDRDEYFHDFLAWFSVLNRLESNGATLPSAPSCHWPPGTAWHALIDFMRAFDRCRIEKTLSMCHTHAQGNNPIITPWARHLITMAPTSHDRRG